MLISKYSVHASLFDKCHHNVIYGKINVCVPLPLVFICEVWNYSKADVQNIQKTILGFNWRKAFESLSVDSKVDLLNETLLNVFRNYIANKNQIWLLQTPLDDWWHKKSLKECSKVTKSYYKNDQQKSDYDKVLEKSADCTKKITQTKNDYINKVTDKLQNPSAALKTYWAILSHLLYDKKITAIPPLGWWQICFWFLWKGKSFYFFFHQYVHQYKT